MPHIIIEFSQDLGGPEPIGQMLDAVHAAVAASGLFDESHIKVRALPVGHYRVGGKHAAFIHAQCRIHAGRSETQKQALSAAVLAAIREQGLAVTVITVEVMEMERASYAKFQEGL